MAHTPDKIYFSLDDIHRLASEILDANPDGIVAYRLLREVLHAPHNDPKLAQAKIAAVKSR